MLNSEKNSEVKTYRLDSFLFSWSCSGNNNQTKFGWKKLVILFRKDALKSGQSDGKDFKIVYVFWEFLIY